MGGYTIEFKIIYILYIYIYIYINKILGFAQGLKPWGIYHVIEELF